MILGKLVLALFSAILLALVGALVGSLTGTGAGANVVNFTDGHQFAIGSGCSSVHNLTFAVPLWGTLIQLPALPINWRLIVICLLAMAATAMVDICRLAALALGAKAWSTDCDLAINKAALTRALQAKPASQGFAARYRKHRNQSGVIKAVRGSCRMRLRDKPPLSRMNVDSAGAHVLVRLGLLGRLTPELAVAARGCGTATIDFSGHWLSWIPLTTIHEEAP